MPEASTVSPVLVSNSIDNRLFVEIYIANSPVKALLDSGAQATLVDESLLFDLGISFSSEVRPSVVSVDNSPIVILGCTKLPIHFNGSVVFHSCLVGRGLPTSFILGIEFWNEFGLTDVLSRAFEREFSGKLLKPKSSLSSCPGPTVGELRFVQPRGALSREQETMLQSAIDEFQEISSDSKGLGCTKWLSHEIITTGSPIRQRYYPLSPVKLKILNEEIDKMLEMGVIRPSRSPWASPVVMVTKKDGSVRFCVDSRKLNSVTVRDSYPLPRIQDILDNLRGARFMTSLDLRSAFWQIPLADKASCEKTAFIVPQRGLFEFVRMPFGLTNAASEMQRLTDMIVNFELTPESEDFVFGYVDDLILVSRDFDSHLRLLRKVRDRLRDAGLTVNLKKCEFCKSELKYLGYIVNEHGLQTDPKKLESISDYPTPTTAKSLRAFIGMCSYYRRFVENFSSIIAPMTALIGKKKGRDTIEWNNEANISFVNLKKALLNSPLMACPDFSKPFILQCDASSVGLGSVLAQKVDGVEQPIAFYSRLFTKCERNYSTTERELLAVLESVKHFRGYLDGMKFTIVTDHIALKWLLTIDNPTGRLARWATIISQFNFDIEHRKGALNVVPDALSRRHVNLVSFALGPTATADVWYKRMFEGVRANPQMFRSYIIRDGVLLRKTSFDDPLKPDPWCIVLPSEKVREAVLEIHNNFPNIHPGVMKTYLRARELYYWPNMFRDVSAILSSCQTCKAFKIANTRPQGQRLYPRAVSAPLDLLSIDLIGPLPTAYYGYRYIFSMVDVFSKFVWLVPLKRYDAKIISQALEHEVILRYGKPSHVLCDNGTVFRSVEFERFLSSYGIPPPCFTPYYSPQASVVEKYNQSVITALSILVDDDHRRWARLLPKVALYLNSCINLATSYTPNFLMYGREIDLTRSGTNVQPENRCLIRSRDERASNLHSLRDVYAKVEDALVLAFQRNATRYNVGRKPVRLSVGDLVWRRNFARSSANMQNGGKFAPRFVPCRVRRVISAQVYELADVDSECCGNYHIKDILK